MSSATLTALLGTSIGLLDSSVNVLDNSETVIQDQQICHVTFTVHKWMILETTVTVLVFAKTENCSNIWIHCSQFWGDL